MPAAASQQGGPFPHVRELTHVVAMRCPKHAAGPDPALLAVERQIRAAAVSLREFPSSICSADLDQVGDARVLEHDRPGWENTAPPGPHSLPSSIDHWLSPLRAIGNSSGGPKRRAEPGWRLRSYVASADAGDLRGGIRQAETGTSAVSTRARNRRRSKGKL